MFAQSVQRTIVQQVPTASSYGTVAAGRTVENGGLARGRGASSSVHIGRAAEAREQVHHMHEQMQQVEATIQALAAENERMKMKLLTDRRATLEKYFLVDDNLAMQAVLGEWKRVMEVLRRMREIDGMENMRGADRQAYEQRIAEMERTLAETNAMVDESQAAREATQTRLEKAELLIRSVGEQATLYPMIANPPTIPSYECEGHMKMKMVEILQNVEQSYVANPGSVVVTRQQQQQQQPTMVTSSSQPTTTTTYVTPRTAPGQPTTVQMPGMSAAAYPQMMAPQQMGFEMPTMLAPPQAFAQQTIGSTMMMQPQSYVTYG